MDYGEWRLGSLHPDERATKELASLHGSGFWWFGDRAQISVHFVRFVRFCSSLRRRTLFTEFQTGRTHVTAAGCGAVRTCWSPGLGFGWPKGAQGSFPRLLPCRSAMQPTRPVLSALKQLHFAQILGIHDSKRTIPGIYHDHFINGMLFQDLQQVSG